MTKNEMVNYIETSKVMVNFDRKWLLRQSKNYLERIYTAAENYNAKKEA